VFTNVSSLSLELLPKTLSRTYSETPEMFSLDNPVYVKKNISLSMEIHIGSRNLGR